MKGFQAPPLSKKIIDKYKDLPDTDLVNLIINYPYDEEAVCFLIFYSCEETLEKAFQNIFFLSDKSPVADEFYDCLSDLFLYLKGKNPPFWKKFRSYKKEPSSGFKAWFYTTAYNRFLDYKEQLLRQKEGRTFIRIDDNDVTESYLDEVYAEIAYKQYSIEEKKAMLLDAINSLDPIHRIVALKYLEGYNYDEIADILEQYWDEKGIKVYERGTLVIPSRKYVEKKIREGKKMMKSNMSN